MPLLVYHPSDFPKSMGTDLQTASGEALKTLVINKAMLAHASFMVGRNMLSIDADALSGPYLTDLFWRQNLITACLREVDYDVGFLYEKSNVYLRLDASEKGFVSYLIGMAVCHLLAQKLLGVTHTIHVDTLIAAGKLDLGTTTRERPDLVGLDVHANKVFSLEAKGRSNGFDQAALDRAKAQTKLMPKALGRPTSKVATEICFDEYLTAYIADPKGSRGDPIDLAVDDDVLFREYYRPVLATLQSNEGSIRLQTETHRDIRYVVAGVERQGLVVGLPQPIFEMLESDAPLERRIVAEALGDPGQLAESQTLAGLGGFDNYEWSEFLDGTIFARDPERA